MPHPHPSQLSPTPTAPPKEPAEYVHGAQSLMSLFPELCRLGEPKTSETTQLSGDLSTCQVGKVL